MTHERLRFVKVNLLGPLPQDQNFKQVHGVINLAGKRIFGRWNKALKRLIYDTRVEGTKNLVSLFDHESFKPKVLVSASAVGFYGEQETDMVTEKTGPGATFLSMVARDWEHEAWKADEKGVRVCLMRNGHILDSAGGLLKVLLPFYRYGLGGPLGSGKQFFPWVSREDAARMYVEALENDTWSGPVNVVAPEQITNKAFSHTVASTLRRPHIFHIPRFALALLFGEFAREMLVSQKVYPGKAFERDFVYMHRSIGACVRDYLS